MRRWTLPVIKYAALLGALVLTVYPVFWMVTTGLKGPGQAADWWSLPWPLCPSNFAEVWGKSNFLRYFLNSALVTAASVGLTVCLAAPAGYALAGLGFRGRGFVFVLFAAGMMVPVHVTLVPLLKFFMLTGLYNTYLGLIAVYVAFSLPVAVVLFTGFFREVPREVLEAAALDGCGPWSTFLRVSLPLARPAVIGVAMLTLVNVWNEFVFALVLLKGDHYTLPLGVSTFRGEYGFGTEVPLMAAALAVAVLPPLLVYAVAQRQLIRGITAGAVKG